MIEWKINQLVRVVETGLVKTIHYFVIATDGGQSVAIHGAAEVDGDPASAGFVSYDNLTEQQVVGWVQEALGADAVTDIEAKANEALQAKLNPVTANGVPWSQA